MRTRINARAAIAAILVVLLGVAVLGRLADAGTNPMDPKQWVDSHGRLDPSRVPARIAVSSPDLEGGLGWVASEAVLPGLGSDADGPYPVYSSQNGTVIVADFYVTLGVVPKGGAASRSSNQTSDTSGR